MKIVTKKRAVRIVSTSKTQPRIDPQWVAKALGAEIVGPSPGPRFARCFPKQNATHRIMWNNPPDTFEKLETGNYLRSDGREYRRTTQTDAADADESTFVYEDGEGGDGKFYRLTPVKP